MAKRIHIPEVTGDVAITVVSKLISSEGDGTETVPCVSISLDKSFLSFENLNSNNILNATVLPTNCTESIIWTSSDSNIAKVANGIVTSVSDGYCTITATCGGMSAKCTVTVESEQVDSPNEDGTTEKIPCTGITISQSIINSTSVPENIQISATLTPSNTTDEISWVVFDKTVAFIDKDGVVTTIGNGETQIHAYCGDYSAYTTLVVNDSTLNEDALIDFMLDIEQPTTDTAFDGEIIIKEKKYNTLTCYPIPGSYLEKGTIYWSCYQPEIIGINTTTGQDQSLYPGKNGEATLTVSYDLGTEGYKRKKYKVIVAIDYELENTEILYDSPTIVMEGCKARASQDGVTQYFDVSYCENPGCPGYNSYLTLTDEYGLTHYLALLDKGTSPFGKNGLHLDSGGWFTLSGSQSGSSYSLNPSLLSWNNFDNWNCTIQNVNDSFPSELLTRALSIYNQTFPGLNMTVDQNSTSTIEMSNEVLDDTQPAFIRMNYSDESFMIYFNEDQVTERSDEYSPENIEWLSTTVHELGHTLGVGDEAAHLPSMYDYGRPYDKNTCIQPNDIAFIKYLHKELYDMDLLTYQEHTNPLNGHASLQENKVYKNYTPNIESKTFFANIPYNNIEEHSDIIVNCKLQYVETRTINISKTRVMELDYNIYNIIDYDCEKGELVNNQLKIPVDASFIEITEDNQYKLYLKKYDNCPCSLSDLYQGIEVIK